MYAELDGGFKVYQAVEFVGNKPKPSGWKIGKMVQRAHKVMETDSSIYIVSRRLQLINWCDCYYYYATTTTTTTTSATTTTTTSAITTTTTTFFILDMPTLL